MFDTYLMAGPQDGEEYGRCANLIDSMLADDLLRRPALPGSLVYTLDAEFADADPTPSTMLTNALDHALHNLRFITFTLENFGGHAVPVTALMSTIRTSLLGSSHLAYVVSGTDPTTAAERMGALYRLETRSARKFVTQLDTPAAQLLPALRPPADSAVRALAAYDAPHATPGNLTESTLLDNLKTVVLPSLIAKLGHNGGLAQVMVDHLFNTTSGAAHGYAWIDTEGVVANLAPQLSVSTAIANVVFNHYLDALDN